MTEKRIREILDEAARGEHINYLIPAICTVAAEARKEGFRAGVEAMRDGLVKKFEDKELLCGIIILYAKKLFDEAQDKEGE